MCSGLAERVLVASLGGLQVVAESFVYPATLL